MPSNTPNPWKDDGSTSAIEQQAADWFVLRDAGLTAPQQAEFDRWLQADERHAQVYAELDETWIRLGELRTAAPATPAVTAERPQRRGKILWLVGALTAAAAAAIACLAWWPAQAPAPAPFSAVASTEVGTMRTLTLPDGSVVRLNTDSAVAVQFTTADRRVRLVRGEAHFQVAKNPARPFVVSAGRVAVRAVGTAFDVRLRPETVEVLVTEGKVRVDDATKGQSLLSLTPTGDTPLLVAGQRAMISLESAVSAPATVAALAPAAIGQALAWQEQRLEFVSTPLSEIVAEFNRYNRHKLVIVDPRLASRRFGGTFAAGDYAELVRLLEADFGAVAERGENETKLRLAP